MFKNKLNALHKLLLYYGGALEFVFIEIIYLKTFNISSMELKFFL